MKLIIVRPINQAKSKSDAVQQWRAGQKFDGLNDAPSICTNQDFKANEEIEIRWNHPVSFTDFVLIRN